jgi:hypothetical protein
MIKNQDIHVGMKVFHSSKYWGIGEVLQVGRMRTKGPNFRGNRYKYTVRIKYLVQWATKPKAAGENPCWCSATMLRAKPKPRKRGV